MKFQGQDKINANKQQSETAAQPKSATQITPGKQEAKPPGSVKSSIEKEASAFWRMLRFNFRDGRVIAFPSPEMRRIECDIEGVLFATFCTETIVMRGPNMRALFDSLWRMEVGEINEISMAEAKLLQSDAPAVIEMRVVKDQREHSAKVAS